MRARRDIPQNNLHRECQEIEQQPSSPKTMLRCFRCRLAHKACRWKRRGKLRKGDSVPDGVCDHCATSKGDIDPCIPVLFADLTEEQRRRLDAEDERRRANQRQREERERAKQQSARRQRSKSSSDSGREDQARRRRPRSETYHGSRQFLVGATPVKEHRHTAQMIIQSPQISPVPTQIPTQTSTKGYPKLAGVAINQLVDISGNTLIPADLQRGTSSGFGFAEYSFLNPNIPPSKLFAEIPEHDFPILARQWAAPQKTTSPPNTPHESTEVPHFESFPHWTTSMESSSQDTFQNLGPAAKSSGTDLSSTSKQNLHGDVNFTKTRVIESGFFQNPKANKGKSRIVLEDIVSEPEAETSEESESSSIGVGHESASNAAHRPHHYQGSRSTRSVDQTYDEEKDKREETWSKLHRRLIRGWPKVYLQYDHHCASKGNIRESRKSRKAVKPHKALQKALQFVKTSLYDIHELAILAERAGDHAQSVLFREDILVQLTENDLWFKDLKQKVRSELIAAEGGNRTLIRHSSRSRTSIPPLHLAIRRRDHQEIIACIREYGGLIDECRNGKTALVIAVEIGDIDIAKLLIRELNADVNVPKAGLGLTPLHLAILQKRYDIVDLLLNNGARVDIKATLDGQAMMAVDLAASLALGLGDNEIQSLIRKARPNLDPWVRARLDKPQCSLIPQNFRDITNYDQQPSHRPDVESY